MATSKICLTSQRHMSRLSPRGVYAPGSPAKAKAPPAFGSSTTPRISSSPAGQSSAVRSDLLNRLVILAEGDIIVEELQNQLAAAYSDQMKVQSEKRLAESAADQAAVRHEKELEASKLTSEIARRALLDEIARLERIARAHEGKVSELERELKSVQHAWGSEKMAWERERGTLLGLIAEKSAAARKAVARQVSDREADLARENQSLRDELRRTHGQNVILSETLAYERLTGRGAENATSVTLMVHKDQFEGLARELIHERKARAAIEVTAAQEREQWTSQLDSLKSQLEAVMAASFPGEP